MHRVSSSTFFIPNKAFLLTYGVYAKFRVLCKKVGTREISYFYEFAYNRTSSHFKYARRRCFEIKRWRKFSFPVRLKIMIFFSNYERERKKTNKKKNKKYIYIKTRWRNWKIFGRARFDEGRLEGRCKFINGRYSEKQRVQRFHG